MGKIRATQKAKRDKLFLRGPVYFRWVQPKHPRPDIPVSSWLPKGLWEWPNLRFQKPCPNGKGGLRRHR